MVCRVAQGTMVFKMRLTPMSIGAGHVAKDYSQGCEVSGRASLHVQRLHGPLPQSVHRIGCPVRLREMHHICSQADPAASATAPYAQLRNAGAVGSELEDSMASMPLILVA